MKTITEYRPMIGRRGQRREVRRKAFRVDFLVAHVFRN